MNKLIKIYLLINRIYKLLEIYWVLITAMKTVKKKMMNISWRRMMLTALKVQDNLNQTESKDPIKLIPKKALSVMTKERMQIRKANWKLMMKRNSMTKKMTTEVMMMEKNQATSIMMKNSMKTMRINKRLIYL